MATLLKRIPARASDTLQGVVRSAGPVSAATRALLWLGAGAAGLPISLAGRREIAALLVENLDAGVLTALQQLYDRLGRGEATSDTTSDTPYATPCATTCTTTRESHTLPAAAVAERWEPGASRAPGHEADDPADPLAGVGVEFEG
jgi:hypothetical protein